MRFATSRALDTVEQRLTVDPVLASAIVDLGSVVRYSQLDNGRPANLLRVGLVVDALARHLNDSTAMAYLVTDRALTSDNELTSNEKMTIRRWADDGLVELLPAVEDRVCELADLTRLPIVSRDDFAWCRDRYPWVGDTGRVLMPVPGAGGAALMAKPGGTTNSGSRLGDAARQVAARLWQCSAPDCASFGAGRVAGQSPPRIGSGAPHCPRHGVPLRDVGPRPPAMPAMVRINGAARMRFAVTAAHPVMVGRSPDGPGAVALLPYLDEQNRQWMSRTHLQLELHGGSLVATDMSTNGSVALVRQRPDEAPQRVNLARGQQHPLGSWDAIELCEGVELGRTGFPATTAAEEPESVMTDAPTIAIQLP